ncbi:hypothetical protein ACFYXF_00625 [Streptomyces sp. NPDC002680]|uniref:hypothetical protein n=1 Tax=Streptomyces sp. NPDC002680 TaxID=3364659 RepID=UPI0036D15939
MSVRGVIRDEVGNDPDPVPMRLRDELLGLGIRRPCGWRGLCRKSCGTRRTCANIGPAETVQPLR